MKTDVKIPEVGESISQGVIAAWLKQDGESVSEGEDLFELDTDKATLAVPSPASGVLSIMIEEGTEVTIGQVVAAIELAAKEKQVVGKENVEYEIKLEEELAQKEGEPAGPASTLISEKLPLSPAVRRLVEQYELDPKTIAGTGKDGRIRKKDVLLELERRGISIDKETGEPIIGKLTQTATAQNRKKVASPVKTEAAKEVSVTEGVVPEGVVPEAERKEAEVIPITGRQNRVKLSTIRKRIAENLLQAKQNAAHVTTFNEIDMSRIIALRKTYGESFEKEHGTRLGFMSFFVKACCNALVAYPVVNAWIEGDEIVYNNYYNIGIAVSTERGLIVPVIRDADKLRFAEIEKAIREFAKRAKEKKLAVDDLTGGTFTITNGGVFGSLLSTPIPSPMQSAILGMHAIQERPAVVDGEVVVRPMMYTALTYDHRLIDGREAVSFLVRVKQCIEDPQRLLIDI